MGYGSLTPFMLFQRQWIKQMERLVLDTLKFLISVAWEGKLISNAHCEQVAVKLEEVGKMRGCWKKNLENPEKKNRSL